VANEQNPGIHDNPALNRSHGIALSNPRLATTRSGHPLRVTGDKPRNEHIIARLPSDSRPCRPLAVRQERIKLGCLLTPTPKLTRNQSTRWRSHLKRQ
jgi:hypothetical protein